MNTRTPPGPPVTLAAASVIGRDHLAHRRNGQDAALAALIPGGAVGVVSDGCGSSEGSECGAQLTASVLCGALASLLDSGAEVDLHLLDRAFATLLGAFEAIVRPAGPAVRPRLLATAVGFCVHQGKGVVFAAGDGVVLLDGVLAVLDEGNAPRYPAYALGAPSVPLQAFPFDASGPFSLVVGTDGLAALDALRLAEATREREAGLVRWLRKERDRAPLADDAALVVARGGEA